MKETIELLLNEEDNIDEIFVYVKLKDGIFKYTNSTIDIIKSIGGLELIKDEILQKWRNETNL